MTLETTVRGEAGMRAFGSALAGHLLPGDVVFLRGEMGMGKSVLARAVARELGVEGPMPSPTFTILLSYEGRLPVRHLDLYRLEDPEEFYEAGLDEQLSGDAVSLVEWPEMSDISPEPRLEVYLSRGAADDIRLAETQPVGMGEEREAALREALRREYP